MKVTVGLVIDYPLFLEAVSDLVDSMTDFAVVLHARNGLELQHQLEDNPYPPDIMMIDMDMPVIDGLETTLWLKEHYPSMKLIAMVKHDRDRAIITMLKAGCCSWVLKIMETGNLQRALEKVSTEGYFNPDRSLSLTRLIFGKAHNEPNISLTTEEEHFLRMACTELSYSKIVLEMNLSDRKANKYINSLFSKFRVTSRTGLVLEALRRGLVSSKIFQVQDADSVEKNS